MNLTLEQTFELIAICVVESENSELNKAIELSQVIYLEYFEGKLSKRQLALVLSFLIRYLSQNFKD